MQVRQSSLQSFAVWFLFFNLFMNFASWGVCYERGKCFLNEPKPPVPGCIGLQLSFNFSIRDNSNLGAESLSVPPGREPASHMRTPSRVHLSSAAAARRLAREELPRMKCKKVQVG